MQVACLHLVATVRVTPGGDPGDDLVGIVDGRQRATGFVVHDLREELIGEAHVHVHKRADPRQLDAQQGFHYREAIGFGQRGIPVAQAFHPAGYGAVHAIHAAVPEVMLGKM